MPSFMFMSVFCYVILALSGIAAGAVEDVAENNANGDLAELSLLQHDFRREINSSSGNQHTLETVRVAPRNSETVASNMLPSLDCVRIITLNDTENLALLTDELKVRGLWNRTTVQVEERDLEDGLRGSFRAHMRTWEFGLNQNCDNLLVFEDDAFFEDETVHTASERTEAFLQSNISYDLLYLGWNGCLGGTDVRVSRIDGTDCAFQLSGRFCSIHAYVISEAGMRKFSTMKYGGDPMDVELNRRQDGVFSTIRPMSAFQRYHPSSLRWSDEDNKALDAIQDRYAGLKAKPDYVHERMEDPVYEASDYGDECAVGI